LGKYLKVAFTNRWNLLLFLGGMALSVLSGRPDVVLPLVLAGEATYLGLLGSNPKFQKYVDAQEAKKARKDLAVSNEQTLSHILRSLPRPARDRFDALRSRCLELRRIAADLKHPGNGLQSTPLDSLQLAGLDRLLWVFLRLLFTQHTLEMFFQGTQDEPIRQDIQRLEEQLASLDENDNSSHMQKIRHTIEDNLETSRHRLANYEKAKANHQFVELEIDRLENKIKSLAEVAINRQEPDYISSQVDQVASSMLETEQTMNELEFITGLGRVDDEVPEVLKSPLHIVR
jgi:chemotaxis protein histidine kinase CheA